VDAEHDTAAGDENGYGYGYPPNYGYGNPYGNGYDSSSSLLLYLPVAAALFGNVPYVGQILSTISGYASPYGTGGYSGQNPYTNGAPYYGNSPSYGNSPYYGNAPSYGTPYDQCLNSTDTDNDGDGACAPVSSGYNGYGVPYGANNSYGLPIGEQQVQGVVVGRTGGEHDDWDAGGVWR